MSMVRKLQTCKNDVRLLIESRQELYVKMIDNYGHMITILIPLSPGRVAEFMVTTYEVWDITLDGMEVDLPEYLMNVRGQLGMQTW